MTDNTLRPAARSLTRRRRLANDARKAVAAYVRYAQRDTSDSYAVNRLLWAQALLSQALWLETHGRLGDQHATAAGMAALQHRTEVER